MRNEPVHTDHLFVYLRIFLIHCLLGILYEINQQNFDLSIVSIRSD